MEIYLVLYFIVILLPMPKPNSSEFYPGTTFERGTLYIKPQKISVIFDGASLIQSYKVLYSCAPFLCSSVNELFPCKRFSKSMSVVSLW